MMDEVVVDTIKELSSLAISITIPVYPQPESTLIPNLAHAESEFGANASRALTWQQWRAQPTFV